MKEKCLQEILFVSHDAGRTGAPLVLLNFQRWLRKHTNLKLTTILRKSGPLEAEFASLGETFLIKPGRWERILRERIASRLPANVGANKRLAALRARPHQLIYSNTVTNGDVLQILARPGLPVITHVHELNYWIDRSGPDNWSNVCRHTTKFVAVSEAVSRNLQERHQIPPARMEVVHEFIPVDGDTPNHDARAGAAMKEQLGIPASAFVVGGSGSETWRKGKDLFVQLAIMLRRRNPSRPFYFVWVGAEGDDEERRQLKHDIELAGIADSFRWTGEVSNPRDYFACFDAFTLVSREDPFPLVCLEAGLMEKPILCFADAGGAAELIEEDSGFVVPYLDLNVMADKLLLLGENEELRRKLGACAAAKVRTRFSLDVMAPRLHRVIDNMLDQKTLT
ncbi:MAG TPA: glycosyltransferase family 4 protein [Candidatus Udaeobacter sp.]|jgi:glycosyltransferase involved in cell wall biosynthesis|nr:glycosyltransferase family 4 protein [Candidatus Udaeobacter sp.]